MLWQRWREYNPNFIVDSERLHRAEWIFLSESGLTAGAARHLDAYQQSRLAVRNLKDNVLASFEIDGEVLDGERVEASLRRQLGIAFQGEGDSAAEMGAAALAMAALWDSEGVEVGDKALVAWRSRYEAVLFPGSPGVEAGLNPEARRELASFMGWYEEARPEAEEAPLLRAGLAHLWFESICPFAAATGVAGRMLAERLLMRALPSRNFIPLSLVCAKYRHEYHRVLDEACRDRDATRWLVWFAAAAVEAGRVSRARLDFAMSWSGLMSRLESRITRKQNLLLTRLFWLGAEGFATGLAVEEQAARLGIPRGSIQRDVSALVECAALRRVVRGGEARYLLNIPSPEVPRVRPEDIV